MIDSIVVAAIDSLLEEVTLHPKPGLVDKYDQGSHDDMDLSTFCISATSLNPYMKEYLLHGLSFEGTHEELFDSIREIGVRAEITMLASTNGVNTHKGANFIFGIVLSAIGYTNFASINIVIDCIKKMTTGLVKRELEDCSKPTTFGELVYKEYGITGIRGEVENGLSLVINHCLPIIFDATISYTQRLKLTLVKLIQINDDTNMIKRGGIEGLKLGKELSRMQFDDLDSHLHIMNDIFKDKNLSPGGSADLLAISIFLHKYHNIINETLNGASSFDFKIKHKKKNTLKGVLELPGNELSSLEHV